MKQLEDVQDFTCNWIVEFAMDDEHVRSRMKESASELASLISSLNLGSEEMCIKEYVQLVEDEIVDASTTWMSWLIWHEVEKFIWV